MLAAQVKAVRLHLVWDAVIVAIGEVGAGAQAQLHRVVQPVAIGIDAGRPIAAALPVRVRRVGLQRGPTVEVCPGLRNPARRDGPAVSGVLGGGSRLDRLHAQRLQERGRRGRSRFGGLRALIHKADHLARLQERGKDEDGEQQRGDQRIGAAPIAAVGADHDEPQRGQHKEDAGRDGDAHGQARGVGLRGQLLGEGHRQRGGGRRPGDRGCWRGAGPAGRVDGPLQPPGAVRPLRRPGQRPHLAIAREVHHHAHLGVIALVHRGDREIHRLADGEPVGVHPQLAAAAQLLQRWRGPERQVIRRAGLGPQGGLGLLPHVGLKARAAHVKSVARQLRVPLRRPGGGDVLRCGEVAQHVVAGGGHAQDVLHRCDLAIAQHKGCAALAQERHRLAAVAAGDPQVDIGPVGEEDGAIQGQVDRRLALADHLRDRARDQRLVDVRDEAIAPRVLGIAPGALQHFGG